MAKAGKNRIRKRSPATWRIVEKLSPYGKVERGWYFQLAVKNSAGFAFGKPCMSFERPYKLEPDRVYVDPRDLKRILHDVGQRFHPLTEYTP